MKREIKLIASTPMRFKRSKGFGIHSPFAFEFVLQVLRQRLDYYAYPDIVARQRIAVAEAHACGGPRPISRKNAKLLFRVACRFNPRVVLQAGTVYGVSTAAVLSASTTSEAFLYRGEDCRERVYADVVRGMDSRIHTFATPQGAVEAYMAALLPDDVPFAQVNSVGDADFAVWRDAAVVVLRRGGVVVVRNLLHSAPLRALLDEIDSSIEHGMTFTNGRIAIVAGLHHLPRQHFSLWF